MDFSGNDRIKLAYEFVENTDKNIFLTGKAGTGKTTFLHSLKNKTPKRMIIVAPTGVAAINAGGVTIHSFFQLPFSPHIPESKFSPEFDMNNPVKVAPKQFKLRKNKIKLIKSLDLLVIDEISMVRADLLDAIDSVLRKYRNNNEPFGGVQLLMIGDLHQLAPVIKEDEWKLIRDHYQTVYFFSSKALSNSGFVTIELQKIYRQEDDNFKRILGEIRNNKLSEDSIKQLNSRFVENFSPDDDEGYITLTTHNQNADEINIRKHNKLKSKAHKFRADIQGDFPEYIYPTARVLELKVGAQIMFIKNDSSFEKLYFNGKIGKITEIDEDIIFVKCPGDHDEIEVKPEKWENIKYSLNEKNKTIDEKVTGSFEQYPLKLAWAITIHKSQGLTFDKAVIDINAAFAFGQVYVALSRCRTLSGLVLSSCFCKTNIKTDTTIQNFSEHASENAPSKEKFKEAMIEYQKKLICELFDFSKIKKGFFYVRKIIKENARNFDSTTIDMFEKIRQKSMDEIFTISEKFKAQLLFLFKNCSVPQENEQIQSRIKKAAEYFTTKIKEIFYESFEKFTFETDNKEVNKTIDEAIEKFELALFTKIKSLEKSLNGFDSIGHIKAISNAELDFKPKFNKEKSQKTGFEKGYPQGDLYKILNAWRKMTAEDDDIPVYMVLPQKSMKQLIEKLPGDGNQLSTITGFGKVKLEKYGAEILEIINDYCFENDIDRSNIRFEEVKKKEKKTKKRSDLISFEMFKNGQSISEIAKERGFVESTIINHLLKYAEIGDFDVMHIIDEKKYLEIEKLIKNNNGDKSLTNLYNKAKGKYSFDEIRITLAGLKAEGLHNKDKLF